ncbi:hypothetical protein GLOIN_2v1790161 [Rhizophagus clarus]|uniref:Uncharacterized protein n=1 Tax=Rhizophagus clarus TaxID=94130 RepID=A0A8H3KN89_9GLOM|nr:hypothetical protein GLOIN_2v1790161 [Rhizophagus clarus]
MVGETPYIYYSFRGNENIIKDSLSKLIDSQKNLKRIIFDSNNAGFIQKIINLTKPFKLKSLFICKKSQVKAGLLQSLLQKSGDYLENFGTSCDYDLLEKQIIDSIIIYCKNIKSFAVFSIYDKTIYSTINLIEKRNLNHLSINIDQFLTGNSLIEGCIKRSSIILQNLGQILPSKLEYLNLSLHIKLNDFKIFLKNSQNTFIKKLLIDNKEGDDILVILPHIKEHIMKKKRVKYLAITDTFFGSFAYDIFRYKDLFYLNDEVEEFRLHNVKVQKYYDLTISITDFIKEVD